MKHRRVISVIAMMMLLAGLAVVPVLAQPQTCMFTGSVTLDGNPVADGTEIVGKVDGTVVGALVADVANSEYAYLIPQVGGVPVEGATVSFYVVVGATEYLGGTGTWNAGLTKELDLEAFAGPVTRYTLTVNVSPAASGTVSLSPTQPADGYVADTEVTLSATAAADYEFSSWGGDASGTSSTTIVTMDSDKSVTAYFESTIVPPPAETFADWLYNTFIA